MTHERYPLSVIIITHNEERNIQQCLKSVAWADDIVVVDAQSADRTFDIARSHTDKVFKVEWNGFVAAREVALQYAVHSGSFGSTPTRG